MAKSRPLIYISFTLVLGSLCAFVHDYLGSVTEDFHEKHELADKKGFQTGTVWETLAQRECASDVLKAEAEIPQPAC